MCIKPDSFHSTFLVIIYFTQSPPEIIYFKNTPAPSPISHWMVPPNRFIIASNISAIFQRLRNSSRFLHVFKYKLLWAFLDVDFPGGRYARINGAQRDVM